MNQERKMYILYDRSTGAIIGTHTVYDAELRSYRTPTIEESRAAFSDLLKERTEDQVDMMEADLPVGSAQAAYRVDVERRQLVQKLQIQVRADRIEIQGDGKDSTEIKISVVGKSGKVVEHFNGDLRVTTTRGRLSTPGGRIMAEHGQASITLTSVAETVERVSVTVQDPSGRCTSGSIDIEFL